jgi:uncharacterized protein DUF6916
MTVSRSNFLKVCAMALMGAGVDLRALEALAPMPGTTVAPAAPLRLDVATATFFRQYLGTAFEMGSPSGDRVRLRLAEVTERPITKNVEQFSLIFHAPPDRSLSDGLHSIHHESLGAFDLFVVPVGAPNRRRTVYQACFSRLRT